jgi:hypothetical protein
MFAILLSFHHYSGLLIKLTLKLATEKFIFKIHLWDDQTLYFTLAQATFIIKLFCDSFLFHRKLFFLIFIMGLYLLFHIIYFKR